MESKEEARGRFRQLRRTSPASVQPGKTLLFAPEISGARIIASFQSYEQEPDTYLLHERLRDRGVRVFLPKLNSDKSLTWLEDGVEISPQDRDGIELIIVPALAVDMRGVRLGQGGGSFDRALVELTCWKVGLIYSESLSKLDLPEESHDVRMDAVATELGITRFN